MLLVVFCFLKLYTLFNVTMCCVKVSYIYMTSWATPLKLGRKSFRENSKCQNLYHLSISNNEQRNQRQGSKSQRIKKVFSSIICYYLSCYLCIVLWFLIHFYFQISIFQRSIHVLRCYYIPDLTNEIERIGDSLCLFSKYLLDMCSLLGTVLCLWREQ